MKKYVPGFFRMKLIKYARDLNKNIVLYFSITENKNNTNGMRLSKYVLIP